MERRSTNMQMDHRIEELIAIGAAVTANCGSCLQYHASEARKAGADDEAIARAVETGRAVRTGAAEQFDRVAAKLGVGGSPSAAPAATAGCAPVAASRGCCG
jgi:AhpD family alkylhydroperoxidase